MPQIRSALRLMKDAHDATHRGLDAWNDDQMRDAIVSARRFLELAEKSLEGDSGKPAAWTDEERCLYPQCKCPGDAPSEHWCMRGLRVERPTTG